MKFFSQSHEIFSKISAPLTKLTQKDSLYKGGILMPTAMAAFQIIILALTSDPVVAFPRSDRQYAIIVDASTGTASVEGRMGAILAQVYKLGTFHVVSDGS